MLSKLTGVRNKRRKNAVNATAVEAGIPINQRAIETSHRGSDGEAHGGRIPPRQRNASLVPALQPATRRRQLRHRSGTAFCPLSRSLCFMGALFLILTGVYPERPWSSTLTESGSERCWEAIERTTDSFFLSGHARRRWQSMRSRPYCLMIMTTFLFFSLTVRVMSDCFGDITEGSTCSVCAF